MSSLPALIERTCVALTGCQALRQVALLRESHEVRTLVRLDGGSKVT